MRLCLAVYIYRDVIGSCILDTLARFHAVSSDNEGIYVGVPRVAGVLGGEATPLFAHVKHKG